MVDGKVDEMVDEVASGKNGKLVKKQVVGATS